MAKTFTRVITQNGVEVDVELRFRRVPTDHIVDDAYVKAALEDFTTEITAMGTYEVRGDDHDGN